MSEAAAALKWEWSAGSSSSSSGCFGKAGQSPDIIAMFDVSVPQASKDLTLYQERAPQNAVYDKSAKRCRKPTVLADFPKPDPDGYLSRLRSLAEGLADPGDSWIDPPETDIALTPRRKGGRGRVEGGSPSCAREPLDRSLLSVDGGRRTDPDMASDDASCGYDGFRWHVRAYCHIDENTRISCCRAFSACATWLRLAQAVIRTPCGRRPSTSRSVPIRANPESTRGRREGLWHDE